MECPYRLGIVVNTPPIYMFVRGVFHAYIIMIMYMARNTQYNFRQSTYKRQTI